MKSIVASYTHRVEITDEMLPLLPEEFKSMCMR